MHNRFKRACYALAGGVAVTATLGLTAAGAANASVHQAGNATPDATTTCGTLCNDVFNLGLGPNYILRTGGHYNSSVYLSLAHNFDPKEDFIAKEVGTLGQFIHNGLISRRSYVALNYPHFWPVLQEEYAPYSATSNLCAGVKLGDVRKNAPIVLRSCGTSARTLWVADVKNGVPDSNSIFHFDWPWVNAADGQYSSQLSLTTNNFGFLSLQPLSFNGGVAGDNQEWGVNPGPAI
jgi:hypothetical protein